MPDALLLLIPLLVLPVVFLFAFAGCVGEDPTSSDEPQTPPPAAVPPATPPPAAVAPETPKEPEKYADVILATADLVSYWRLNESETGDPTAHDSAPSPHDGQYKGLQGVSLGEQGALALVKDPNDKAAEFDGTQGFVEVPFDPLLNPPLDFSVEAWIRPTSTSGATQVVLGSQETAAGEVIRGFVLEVIADPSPRISARVGNGTGSTAIEAPLGPGTQHDKWHHVVLTYNGGAKTLALYVDADDGKPDAELGPPTSPAVDYSPNLGASLRIAAGYADGQGAPLVPGHFFAGRIDEVALYRSTLPGTAVRGHFLAAVSQ